MTSIAAIAAMGATSTAQDTPRTTSNTINQDDFIKLFLSQLQFQDPLEPVDNREFLAQMAQFTALEHARQTSENTQNQLVMELASQALTMLNKVVTVSNIGNTSPGRVTAVNFTDQGPELTVQIGQQSYPRVKLGDIDVVTPSPFDN